MPKRKTNAELQTEIKALRRAHQKNLINLRKAHQESITATKLTTAELRIDLGKARQESMEHAKDAETHRRRLLALSHELRIALSGAEARHAEYRKLVDLVADRAGKRAKHDPIFAKVRAEFLAHGKIRPEFVGSFEDDAEREHVRDLSDEYGFVFSEYGSSETRVLSCFVQRFGSEDEGVVGGTFSVGLAT